MACICPNLLFAARALTQLIHHKAADSSDTLVGVLLVSLAKVSHNDHHAPTAQLGHGVLAEVDLANEPARDVRQCPAAVLLANKMMYTLPWHPTLRQEAVGLLHICELIGPETIEVCQ
jgi:hypothetical protein